jgi:hypothetical protein
VFLASNLGGQIAPAPVGAAGVGRGPWGRPATAHQMCAEPIDHGGRVSA